MNISKPSFWRKARNTSNSWQLFYSLLFLPGVGLTGQSIPSGPALESIILHHDSIFWAAYNACDLETMISFVDEEAEFYHDKGGRLNSAASLKSAMKSGLCAGGNNQIERRPITESIKVFPLAGVGAILRGQHTFHGVDHSNDDGIAHFFHLWELKPSGWIMTRIFSYDHAPLPANVNTPVITLSTKALSKFVGTYQAPKTGVISIQAGENGLSLIAGNEPIRLLAKSATVFFSKQRPLEFKFAVDEQGFATKLSVYEHGEKVEEAIKVKK